MFDARAGTLSCPGRAFGEASGLPIVPEVFGQMASFELDSGSDPDAVQQRLWLEHRIEVPCFEWNGRPLLRLSVQGYNTEEDIARLVAALCFSL